MKQLRRLDVTAPQDAYRRLQRGLLRYSALAGEEFRRLERERPGHIVEEGNALLIGQPRRRLLDLHYAFPDRDAFVRLFPGMFQRLLAAVDREEAPLGFRFRLTDRPTRPYVEPVLFAHAFEVNREWLRMNLVELPEAGPPADELAPGFRLRPVTPEDVEAVIELEQAAFATPQLPAEPAELLDRSLTYRVLEEEASGRLVASLLLWRRDSRTGDVGTLAVHPGFQRRGLGEALLRWALAWFRVRGLRRATLTVNTDNAPAIGLYRKLGFAPGVLGLDYRRPLDEDEVRQVLEKHQGVHVKFGGWR